MFKLFKSRPDYQLIQLAKYGVFLLGLDSIRSGNRDMGIRTYMGWVAQWMPPDWSFVYDPEAQTIQFSQTTVGSSPVYAARLDEISRDNPIGDAFSRLSEADNHRVIELISDLGDQLGDQLYEEQFEDIYIPHENDTDAELAAYRMQIDDRLREAWDHISRRSATTISFSEAKRLAKLALLVHLVELLKIGIMNVGYLTFISWADGWLYPEWRFLLPTFDDPGMARIVEFSEGEQEGRFTWRGPYYKIGESIPLTARFKELDFDSEVGVKELAAVLGRSMDMPKGPILDSGPTVDLHRFLTGDQIELRADANEPVGIDMVDSGFASKWHQVQAVKLGLCLVLSNRAAVQNMLDIGFSKDPRGCANWSAQWLQPHWELVVTRDISSKWVLPDAEVQLYPLTQDGRREALYYSGPFSDVIEGKIRLISDIAVDNGLIASTIDRASSQYGQAQDINNENLYGDGLASLKGPEVYMPHSQHNDKVIEELLESAFLD